MDVAVRVIDVDMVVGVVGVVVVDVVIMFVAVAIVVLIADVVIVLGVVVVIVSPSDDFFLQALLLPDAARSLLAAGFLSDQHFEQTE